jgi:Na+-driven multidrug efflux pump
MFIISADRTFTYSLISISSQCILLGVNNTYLGTALLAAYILKFPRALGNANCIMVGHAIGENKPFSSLVYLHLTLFSSSSAYHLFSLHAHETKVFIFRWYTLYIYLVATATATAACLLIWREGIGHLFSSDDEVAEIVSTTIPTLCSKTWADGTEGVTSGTFSTVGRQSWKFWTSLVEYCFIGLPLAFYFAFQTSLGVNGLWLANLILANCYAIILACSYYFVG